MDTTFVLDAIDAVIVTIDVGVAQEAEGQTLNLEDGVSSTSARTKKHYPNPPGRGNGAQKWTPEELNFLLDLYKEDEMTYNRELAYDCTGRFGRLISEGSVKGALHRLRLQGRIDGNRLNPRNGEPRTWALHFGPPRPPSDKPKPAPRIPRIWNWLA